MKHMIVIVLVLSFFVVGCGDKRKEELERLEKERDALKVEVSKKSDILDKLENNEEYLIARGEKCVNDGEYATGKKYLTKLLRNHKNSKHSQKARNLLSLITRRDLLKNARRIKYKGDFDCEQLEDIEKSINKLVKSYPKTEEGKEAIQLKRTLKWKWAIYNSPRKKQERYVAMMKKAKVCYEITGRGYVDVSYQNSDGGTEQNRFFLPHYEAIGIQDPDNSCICRHKFSTNMAMQRLLYIRMDKNTRLQAAMDNTRLLR